MNCSLRWAGRSVGFAHLRKCGMPLAISSGRRARRSLEEERELAKCLERRPGRKYRHGLGKMGSHVMTALAVFTGTRVMATLMQRWSSRSSRVVFKGTRTPGLTSTGKMSLTTCCWAAMMSSRLLGAGAGAGIFTEVIISGFWIWGGMRRVERGGSKAVNWLVKAPGNTNVLRTTPGRSSHGGRNWAINEMLIRPRTSSSKDACVEIP